MLEEKSIRNCYIAAIVNEPLRESDINDVMFAAVSKTMNILENSVEKFTELANSRHPTVTGSRALDLLRVDIKNVSGITVNKKNIEYRSNFSVRQFCDGKPFPKNFFDIFEGVYGLKDVVFDLYIYRIGQYSYYAVEAIDAFDLK